jgi:transposase
VRQIEGLHERRFLIHRSEDETEIRAGQSAGRASTIGRQTRRHYSAKEKVHIVLEGCGGEESISELCRREGIAAWM